MANAQFVSSTYTIPGTTREVFLKYLLCCENDIVLRSISGSVKDSGYYGVNGTFFAGGNLIGVAINNGSQIRNYGTMNRDPQQMGTQAATGCGTYFLLKEPQNNIMGGTDIIAEYEGHNYEGIQLSISNTKFAIGGTSLFTSETSLTQNAYYSRILNENPPPYAVRRSRTAIVYFGGSIGGLNTALLTVHGPVDESNSLGNNYVTMDNDKGVTLWELRNLINDVFAPMVPEPTGVIYHAVALDGGGSTQIAYKASNGARVTYQSVDTYENHNRTVYSMLCVPM